MDMFRLFDRYEKEKLDADGISNISALIRIRLESATFGYTAAILSIELTIRVMYSYKQHINTLS